MRAGKPWNAMRSPAMSSQRCRCALSGNSSLTLRSVAWMSSGSPDSATQRNGPLPSQKSGRMYAGTKPGKRERVGHAFVVRDLADVVAVVERGNALARGSASIASHVRLDRLLRRRDQRRVLRGIRLRRAPALHGPAGGQIAVHEVVRGRLVGDHVAAARRAARAPAGSPPRCRGGRRSPACAPRARRDRSASAWSRSRACTSR